MLYSGGGERKDSGELGVEKLAELVVERLCIELRHSLHAASMVIRQVHIRASISLIRICKKIETRGKRRKASERLIEEDRSTTRRCQPRASVRHAFQIYQYILNYITQNGRT